MPPPAETVIELGRGRLDHVRLVDSPGLPDRVRAADRRDAHAAERAARPGAASEGVTRR